MLQIKDLTISYKRSDISALSNISLQIDTNSLVVIAGASGSGKSSIAKAIMNLLPRGTNKSGTIALDNNDISTIKRDIFFKSIGFLPQFPMDYILNLLVYDEIAFPLENIGHSKEEIDKKVTEILDLLHISHLKNKIVTELSSGELQKVSLATALISKPSLLILDEPFARMDPNSELNLVELLQELKVVTTIIILEHHLDYILELADQLVILEQGKIIAKGNPKSIIQYLKENRPEITKIKIPNQTDIYISYNKILTEILDYLN